MYDGLETARYIDSLSFLPSPHSSPSYRLLPLSLRIKGPVPDTLTFVQKMEREAAERAKGQQADNRSFFAKYWMYIVPAVILLVMQSAAAPPEGG